MFIGNSATGCGDDVFLQSRKGRTVSFSAISQASPACPALGLGVRSGTTADTVPPISDSPPTQCFPLDDPGFPTGGVPAKGPIVSYSCDASALQGLAAAGWVDAALSGAIAAGSGALAISSLAASSLVKGAQRGVRS